MHWSNGKFHETITVVDRMYITDHKHIAVYGTKDYTGFGETGINSYLYGKDVGVTANNKYYSDSQAGSNLWSKKYIRLEAGSSEANHGSENGSGIEIVSKNGKVLLSAEGYEATIKSTSSGVSISAGSNLNMNAGTYANVTAKTYANITAGSYINLNAGSGIVVNNGSYGTSLPSYGTEGQMFFKLIS